MNSKHLFLFTQLVLQFQAAAGLDIRNSGGRGGIATNGNKCYTRDILTSVLHIFQIAIFRFSYTTPASATFVASVSNVRMHDLAEQDASRPKG